MDATEAEYESLSKAIQNMAKEIPASAEEIASVAEIAGQLGIAKDDLMTFTRTMVDLGVSTNMSAEEAATSLARLANITGMSMKDIDRLGSTVVDLGNNLATTESEITEMALRLAGAGSQIGLTEDQILSFAAALSSVGIQAEAGGTAFSRVFLEMNTAVMNGGDTLSKFAKIAGMSSSDFAKAFEEDASKALITFIDGLSDLSDEGANTAEILADLGLGEIRVRDSLMRAAGASDVFSKSLSIGNKAWNENTALTKEAQERYNTFASKMKVLRNRFENILKTIGGPFMDALSGIIDGLDPVISAIERMAEWFANASKPVQQFITTSVLLIPVLATIGAAIGAFLMLVGTVTAALAGATAIFGTLGTAIAFTAKVVGIATGAFLGIAGGIAFVITTIRNFDKVKDGFIDGINNMLDSMGAFGDALRNFTLGSYDRLLRSVAKVSELASEGIDKLKDSGITLTDALRNLAGPLTAVVTVMIGLTGPVGWLISSLVFLATKTNIVSDTMKAFKGEMEFSEVIKNAADMASKVIENMAEMATKAIEVGAGLVVNLIEGLSANIPTIADTAVEIITTLIGAITEAIPLLAETYATIITTLVETIAEMIPVLAEVGVTIITTLINTIAENLPRIIELGVFLLTTLINAIVENLPMLIETGITLINTLIDTVVELLPVIIDAGIQILTALIDGIIEILPALIDAALTIILALVDALIENLPTIIDAGIEILLALVKGIIDVLPALIDAALTLIIALAVAIIDNLPKIIEAGVEILFALIKGILDVLPELVEAAYTLVVELVGGLLEKLPDLFDAGVDLILEFVKGLGEKIGDVYDKAKEIGDEMISGLPVVGTFYDMGKNLIGGLRDGMESMRDKVVEKSVQIGGIIDKVIKKKQKIFSPSRVMRDEVGKMIGKGLIVGMDAEIANIQKMAARVSEAATPEQPKLAGFDTSNLRNYSRQATSRLQAEMQASGTFERDGEQNALLAEIRDELRSQREKIIEMDREIVGRLVEPEVSKRQARNINESSIRKGYKRIRTT